MPFDGLAARRKDRTVPPKRPKQLPKPKPTHERHAKASVARPDHGPAKALLPTLDQALTAVTEHVTRCRAQAVEADRDGAELAAEGLRRNAKRYAPAASKVFQDAAWRLVRLVSVAVQTGETAHVIAIAKHLEARKRREWLRVCRMLLLYREPDFTLTAMIPEMRQAAIDGLPIHLGFLDEKASRLTSGQVAAALEGRANSTLEGAAARLACACGAWGYGVKDFTKAKKAFENLPPEEIDNS